MKKHAPATLRNRDAIADVLRRELPATGIVLEVASGSGEHALYFAERFPGLVWHPTDPSAEALASIAAYREEYEGDNLREPNYLDASDTGNWPAIAVNVILCSNMVHISPWDATQGLFAGAAAILAKGGKLILYGPYFEPGVDPASSNLAFDQGLRERNSEWGIRTVTAVDGLAERHGLARSARYEMPANNLTLVYQQA